MFVPCPKIEQPDVCTMSKDGTARCLYHVERWNSAMFVPCPKMEQRDVCPGPKMEHLHVCTMSTDGTARCFSMSTDGTSTCLYHVHRWNSPMFAPCPEMKQPDVLLTSGGSCRRILWVATVLQTLERSFLYLEASICLYVRPCYL